MADQILRNPALSGTIIINTQDERRNLVLCQSISRKIQEYIREDLNSFLNEWFDSWELSLIEDTYLGETKNPAFGTSDDPGVSDKLFLLSAEEVLRYFDPAEDQFPSFCETMNIVTHANPVHRNIHV